MSIWEYAWPSRDVKKVGFPLNCPYCQTNMTSLGSDINYHGWGPEDKENYTRREVQVCACCGWWNVRALTQHRLVQEYGTSISGACGSLKNLDLTDLGTPIEEVKEFLCTRYKGRFSIDPKLFEETVSSVFKGLGYHARVTGATGDGGIDIVLDGDKGDTVGVQVKRWRSSISVEQIRSFAGAMVLGGYTKGIYVTTSRYQAGVLKTVERFKGRGLLMQLIDSKSFYDALKISQRKTYITRHDETAPYFNCRLTSVSSESGMIME